MALDTMSREDLGVLGTLGAREVAELLFPGHGREGTRVAVRVLGWLRQRREAERLRRAGCTSRAAVCEDNAARIRAALPRWAA